MHALLHSVPSTLQQATADLYLHRRHSNTVLAQSLCGLWVLVYIRFVWALQVSLASMRFDSKCDFAPPTVLLWLLLCPWTWDIFFFGGIQHFPADGCSAACCNFGVLTGEDGHTSFYSTIFKAPRILNGILLRHEKNEILTFLAMWINIENIFYS